MIRLLVAILAGGMCSLTAHAAEPRVAIHDSELTRALINLPASATTPQGSDTTGYEWWLLQWRYPILPESMREALTSDGTPYTVVSDADIRNGALLDANGAPQYPIVISLAAEAVSDDEVAPLLKYVQAGGTVLVGSSSFTRKVDGTTRGDFAIANAMGVHMVYSKLVNWIGNYTISKQIDHRLVSHIPSGALNWRMPLSSDEISWGISPSHSHSGPHLAWRVWADGAQTLIQDDKDPYLLVKDYGKGRFIYYAPINPLLGHGGWAPGMYAYGIFREAIQWAFESLQTPLPRLSPWPFPYDAAFNVRHDFENFQDMINKIESSARYEYSAGAKGDYYFCTGTLRVDMGNSPLTIASLQRAVTNYHATIGPHNGGLSNPANSTLTNADYDYWHWGLDEALDTTPAGYASGKAYAQISLANSFNDVEGWLAGLGNANGLRVWVSPYFNSTREESLDILAQLGVSVSGEQKLTPFPHWTLSTRTSGKRYPFISVPVSDWYVGTSMAQSLDYHNSATMRAAVDFYYNLGALVNIYSHASSDSGLPSEYVSYCAAKPKIWPTNAAELYAWWWNRSGVQISPALTSSGSQSRITLAISGTGDPQTAVEVRIPDSGFSGLEVLRDGVPASADQFRVDGQRVRVLAGAQARSVEVRYIFQAIARDDAYTLTAGQSLTTAAPGVLANDGGTNLTATLVTAPSNGTLQLNADGGFIYTPTAGFSGTDRFTYVAQSGTSSTAPATVNLTVNPATSVLFSTDFSTGTISPWTSIFGTWSSINGAMQGSSATQNYGYAYYNAAWGDYTLQGRVQLPAGAYGGGLGGRLNAATGAHYGVWLYPVSSTSSKLYLVKFRTWTSWGGTPMAQASIPAIGTSWHTLNVTFQGNRIQVSCDGIPGIDVIDNGFDSRAAYTSGGITADLWTNNTAYTMNVDDIVVTGVAVGNRAPVANNDTYSLVSGTSLNLAAPGILANDTDADGNPLTAVLVAGPVHGTVNLNANGGFTYTPVAGFSGTDQFTYQANDGQALSGTATVNLTVTSTPTATVLFSSDFSSDTISPWNVIMGTWTASGGIMQGVSTVQNYAAASYPASWGDYTLQGRLQFASGAFGGGLSGHFNPATGERYAAWIYPEGSSGGSAVLKLVKFRGATSWSGTPMAQVPLPSVGTAWHTLKLTFQGTRIQVAFDGTPKIDVTDNGFDNRAAYATGGITAELWIYPTVTPMNVDDITVSTLGN